MKALEAMPNQSEPSADEANDDDPDFDVDNETQVSSPTKRSPRKINVKKEVEAATREPSPPSTSSACSSRRSNQVTLGQPLLADFSPLIVIL